MLQIEEIILATIRDHDEPLRILDIMNIVHQQTSYPYKELEMFICGLRNNAFIKCSTESNLLEARVKLTLNGLHSLESKQDAIQQSAKKERNNRIENHLKTFQTIVSIVSCLFGLASQHFGSAVSFLTNFFH